MGGFWINRDDSGRVKNVVSSDSEEYKQMSFRDKRSIVLTTGQVAHVCRAAPRTVVQWAEKGLIEHYKLPGSADRRFHVPVVIEFLREHGLPLNELEDYADWRVLVIDPPVVVISEQLVKAVDGAASFTIVRSAVAGAAAQCRTRPDVLLVYASVGRRAAVELLEQYEQDRMVWGRAYAVCDPTDTETEQFLKDAGYRKVFRTDTPIEEILHEIVIVAADETARGLVSANRKGAVRTDGRYKRIGPMWIRRSQEEYTTREKIKLMEKQIAELTAKLTEE